MGAPKLLKTMADDRILVFLNAFADPSKIVKRDPRFCLLATWVVSFSCVMIADLQEITKVITVRPSRIPSLCTRSTRAGIEWCFCHCAVCMARPR